VAILKSACPARDSAPRSLFYT